MLDIELADEILDFLTEFVNSFIPIQGVTTNTNFNTIYELQIPKNETFMVTFSVLGSVDNKRAGLKRSAVFINNGFSVEQINVQQSDFTSRTDNDFNCRLVPGTNTIHIQVKSSNGEPTRWRGSLQIERLGD